VSKPITIKITGDADGLKKALGGASTELDKFGTDTESMFSGLAIGAGVAGVAVGAAFVAGVSEAMEAQDFQAGLDARWAATGTDAAGSIGAAAQAAYLDGWDREAVGAGIEAAVSLDPSLSDKLGDDAGSLLGGVIDAFDLEGPIVGEVLGQGLADGTIDTFEGGLDTITTAISGHSAEWSEEFLSGVREYGPALSEVGIGIEEIAAATATATSAFEVDKRMDAMKEFYAIITTDSPRAISAIEELGFAGQETVDIIAAGGDEAVAKQAEVAQALLDIEDPAERARLAAELYGTMVEDMDLDSFLEGQVDMESGFETVEGAAGTAGDMVADTLSAKFTAFKRNVMDKISKPILEHILPAFERFLGAMEPVFGFIQDNAAPIAGAMGVVAVAIGTVLIPIIWAKVAAWTAAAVAMIAANAPLILITVAIAALVAGVIWVVQNLDIFKNVIGAVASFFSDTVWPMIQTAVDGIVAAFWWLVDSAVMAWDAVYAAIETAIVWITETFTAIVETVTEVWNTVWETTVEVLTAVWDTIVEILGFILELWLLQWQLIWEGIKLVWEGIQALVELAIDAVLLYIETAIAVFTTAWDLAWGAIETALQVVWDAIVLIAETAIDKLVTGVETVINGFQIIWDTVWGAISTTFQTIWDGIYTTVETVWNKVSTFIDTGISNVVGFVTAIPGAIKEAVTGAFDPLKEAFKSAVNFIIDGWNGLSFTIPGFDPPGPGSFPDITISTPNIPRLAKGGVIDSATLALVGEGGETEIVTPERLMGEIVRKELRAVGGHGGATIVQNFHGFSTEEAKRLAREGTEEAFVSLQNQTRRNVTA